MLLQGQVGPQVNQDGTFPDVRLGRSGELVAQQLHGQYYEQVARGNVYSIGCSLTALASTTILLTSSAQPIVGVWNPANSSVNLVMLKAMLLDLINNVTSVALGAFVWAASEAATREALLWPALARHLWEPRAQQ